jgi:methylglutaconyl-CoA hydratase
MNANLVERVDVGPVAILTLNRPEQRNALSRSLVARLRDEVDRVESDSTIRVVVLTGAGPAFCAGMDLKEASENGTGRESEEKSIAALNEFADLLQRIHTLPKPTIAAVNGDALAGGAGLMAACDLAIAADAARIGYPEVRRGLVAAIVMHDLARQIGDRRARQLLLSGDLIASKIAHEWGLVNAVTSADRCVKEAIRVGHSLADCAPGALAWTKRLLDEAAFRPPNLRGAAAVSASVRASDEAREGILAFVEKRPPRWTATPAPASPST